MRLVEIESFALRQTTFTGKSFPHFVDFAGENLWISDVVHIFAFYF